MLLQKSHREPLPPSHVYALATETEIVKPGSWNCVTGMPDFVTVAYGTPPVMLRLINFGDEAVQAGKFVIGLGAFEPPFARVAVIDGLEVVTKLPHTPDGIVSKPYYT
jgi:hypothetical protein